MDIGQDSQTVVSLDANHRDLCKFADQTDAMYRNVFRRIQELVQDAPSVILARFNQNDGE